MARNRPRVAVFLNATSGPGRSGAPPEVVSTALRSAGLEPDIIPLRQTADLRNTILERVAAGCAVIAAGGDGTVSSVGAVVAGTGGVMGVLPSGTLNHFARDLGLPLDLDAAAAVVARGETVRVDVGEVNGHVFLNNSSIGLYPTVVAEREALIHRGIPKRLAVVLAAFRAISRFPNLTVRVSTERGGLAARTPVVFVGNNEYHLDGAVAGTRGDLRRGTLHLCTIVQPKRLAVLRAAALALMGRMSEAPDLHSAEARRIRIETFRHHVKVALDGELVQMRSPLVYSIRPRALRVFAAGNGTAEE